LNLGNKQSKIILKHNAVATEKTISNQLLKSTKTTSNKQFRDVSLNINSSSNVSTRSSYIGIQYVCLNKNSVKLGKECNKAYYSNNRKKQDLLIY